MTTFVLVPGAGGQGSYWDEVVAELERLGHKGIAVDIREDDPTLGLPEYAATVDAAIPDAVVPVLVAQSLGGFTAPMVTMPLERIVLVNAMVPLPGESPGDWWGNVGAVEARTALDAAEGRSGFAVDEHFLHDVPDDVKQRMYAAGSREPSDTPFGQPCTFDAWPADVQVLVGADDRFFPKDLQVRVARERLGVEPVVIPGGHLVAKSRPVELVRELLGTATVRTVSGSEPSRP